MSGCVKLTLIYAYTFMEIQTHSETDRQKRLCKHDKSLTGDLDKRYKVFITMFFNFAIDKIFFNIKHRKKTQKNEIIAFAT